MAFRYGDGGNVLTIQCACTNPPIIGLFACQFAFDWFVKNQPLHETLRGLTASFIQLWPIKPI
jgi:hypothetical protein